MSEPPAGTAGGTPGGFPREIEIPFNRPALVGEELRYMREAIAAGRISGDGGRLSVESTCWKKRGESA